EHEGSILFGLPGSRQQKFLVLRFLDVKEQFDREDLDKLWTLVKETLSIRQASSDKEKELWVELKRLFDPYFEEQLWTHTKALMHETVEWRLYDTCGVHHMWTLVKETLSIRQASSDKEKELWVELKRLFEPYFEEQLWTHTKALMHDPVEWRLYDTCGVHHAGGDQEIFMLVEKDYPLRRGLAIVMIRNKLQGRIVRNKMLKSFPLPVMKVPLLEYFPTASEEVFPLLSQRDAPAKEVCTAVKVAVQIQSDHLCDEAQRENDEFLKTVDENMQKIIKEQVKEQVKVQVSKILPRIEQTVNEQLEAKVLTRSSHLSKTSYAVVADLSEMKLKKILIEKMKGHKSIQRSDEQRIFTRPLTLRWTIPGLKRRREGNEPKSASAPMKTATRSADRSTQGSRSRQVSTSESALAEEPMQITFQMEEPSHPEFDTGAEDQPISTQGDTLTPKLLAGPTYELMKGSCKSLVELEYHLEEVFKATTDQLDWVNPEGQQEDDKLYKFKEGDFKRLCIQDIEDMLLLLVQGKLTNLTVEECFAFNISLRMFTRSIVIQRHVEDLQLGVESYQKKLNLTKPDSDGTLIDVRTALDDRLKGIRMQYLPQSIWRKSDKDRVTAMIQAIDKRLKTRRITRSLERFVGGRLYEGDFKMLQRTI
nr:hypothetical protein [Tanacetum cinerariifolium]